MLNETACDQLRRLEIIPLEDEAFATAPGSGRLFHLNATARIVADLLKSGIPLDELAQTFAETHCVPPSQVMLDVETLVHTMITDQSEADSPDQSVSPAVPLFPEPTMAAAYRLFGHVVRVEYPTADVATTCGPLLAPMAVPLDTPNDLLVTYKEIDGSYEVACGSATVRVPRAGWSAFVGLQRAVLCHDERDPGPFQTVLHGGAVVGRNGAWLIGGASGRGKSTLVARLDAAGLRVLGDDLVPLAPEDGRAFPFAMALSIKEGGWSVVRAFRPDLMKSPPQITRIGKTVRYVAPINGPLDEDRQGQPVAGLLLPRRTVGADPTIKPIGLKQAMIGLCDRFGRFPVEPRELRSLVSLAARIPRYELVYDDFGDLLPGLLGLL